MEVKISFHYGGTFFSRNNKILYRKGKTCLTGGYDPDLLSYFELLDIFKERTEVVDVKELWYLPAGLTINEGLKQLVGDSDIISMVESISADRVAHVYVVGEGDCSPAKVLADKARGVNVAGTPVRRSPRNVDASKKYCLAIVVYKGDQLTGDQPSGHAGTSHIPTQGSDNMHRNQSDPQSFAGSDENLCSADQADSDVSVDCDYKETDDEDEDFFYEKEGQQSGDNSGDNTTRGDNFCEDIARDFDFENVPNADVYPDSDVDDDSDGFKSPVCSDDDEPNQKKFIVFNHMEGFAGPIHLEEGMLFASKEIFKKAITQFSVERGGDFYYLHNDNQKVNVLCKNKCECPWKHCRRACGANGCGTLKCRFRAAARLYSDDGTFQLKSLTGDHTCGKQFFIGKIRSKFLAEKYIDHYKDDPEMKLRVFINTVRRDFGVNITYAQACRTRKIAYLMIQGDAREQYALVCDYAETMIKHRVADAAYVHCHGSIEKPIFQRFFVCLKACSRGFFVGCRRLIGVDGCHLRGAYSGQILSAVGKDANDNIYPVAYAVVESECKETWGWFLENLMPELGDFDLCIMSDRQKGLLEALKDIAPMTEQRFCVRHLYGNFRTKFGGGVMMRALIWQAARASRRVDFEAAMKEIRDKSAQAADWLMEKGVSSWSRHAFKEFSKSDMLLNNICESWNKFILEARDKPILTCCEWIRRALMQRMAKKKQSIMQWERQLTPKVHKRLEVAKKIGQEKCHVIIGGHNRYEVEHHDNVYIVDMNKLSCSCNRWGLTGIPCPHAAVVILSTRGLVLESYVDKYYTKGMWLLAYEENIATMPGRKEWEKSSRPSPQPPVFKQQPGRPKKKRRREEGEEGPSKRLRAFRMRKYKCRMCGTEGHTKKSRPQNPNRIIPQRRRKQMERSMRATRNATEDLGTNPPTEQGQTQVDDETEPLTEQVMAMPARNNEENPAEMNIEGNINPESMEHNHDVTECSDTQPLCDEAANQSGSKKQKKKKGKGIYLWDDPGQYMWEDAPVTGSVPTSPVQWSWGRNASGSQKGSKNAEEVQVRVSTTEKGKDKVADVAVPPEAQKGKEEVAATTQTRKGKHLGVKIRGSPEYRRSSRLRNLPTTQLRRKPLWKI